MCGRNYASMTFGTRIMKTEELHATVMKVWEDKSNLTAISRAFSAQHQISSAIIHYRGRNTYLSEKGGMHFGIRKVYRDDVNVEGGVMAAGDGDDENNSDTTDYVGLAALKFRSPNVKELPFGKLTSEMKSRN